MRFLASTTLAVLLIAPGAHAQNQEELARKKMAQAGAENQADNQKRLAELTARVPLEAPVKGAPYSADIVVESSQTLADGNHISNKSMGHVARDSEGRTRREQEGAMLVVTRAEPVITTKGMTISIVDPVGGYSYSLNPEQKIAWRTPIGASAELLDKIKAAAAQRSSQPMTDEQKARMTDEVKKLMAERAAQSTDAPSQASSEAVARARSGGPGERGGAPGVPGMRGRGYAVAPETPLEHKTIDGLAVEGRQHTETIPAGQIGNEQPIVVTSEEWRSPDLKVLVLTRHNDPRTGESTYRLTNVIRVEPDPSLFMVPPDYTVKDTNIRRNNE